MKFSRGVFITFEGGEGTGKTTQACLLREHIAARGFESILTREPGGTQVGDRIRAVFLHPDSAGMDPLTELLLIEAARRQHVNDVIAPALARGIIVVCDRFSDATMAYQGYGRGLGLDLVRRLNRLADGGRQPDLTVLINLESAGEGLIRANRRHDLRGTQAEKRLEQEALEFHDRVRRGYLALARRHPKRIRTVDGRGSVEDVRQAVSAVVRKQFPGARWAR